MEAGVAGHRSPGMGWPPRGVWLSAGFFVASGLLEIATSLVEMPRPLAFWPVWEALGRGLMSILLAAGLWSRIALCRSLALVYCLATLVTCGVALGLAATHAPLRFPPSLVLGSLFQVPSCVVLLPFLRSSEAARLFPRPLLGRWGKIQA